MWENCWRFPFLCHVGSLSGDLAVCRLCDFGQKFSLLIFSFLSNSKVTGRPWGWLAGGGSCPGSPRCMLYVWLQMLTSGWLCLNRGNSAWEYVWLWQSLQSPWQYVTFIYSFPSFVWEHFLWSLLWTEWKCAFARRVYERNLTCSHYRLWVALRCGCTLFISFRGKKCLLLLLVSMV